MIVRSLNAFIQLYRVQSLFWNKQSPEDIDTNMVLEATAPCAGLELGPADGRQEQGGAGRDLT